MANSKHPGVVGHRRRGRAASHRTPGPLGRHDSAQPDFFALQGDTPGSLGMNRDWAENQAVCRAPDSLRTFRIAPAPSPPPKATGETASKDIEVWAFSKSAFIQALSTGAAYTSPVKDALTWKKLWVDFGLKGKYYLKTVNGAEYIIFKGYAGLRETITGTRYLAENPKVLSMAIGRSGVIKSGVEGGVLSLVLVGAADVVEYLLRDDETLGELGVKLFSDLTKTLIATVIATAAAALVATLGAPIVVPLAVSIAVGVIASKGLDYLDEKFKLTEKLHAWVDHSTNQIEDILSEARRHLNEAARRAADAVDVLIRLKRDYDQLNREFEELRRLLDNPIPRLY